MVDRGRGATVNNRHFKLSAKISDPTRRSSRDLEQLVREKVRRGTVQVNLRIDRPRRAEDYRLNTGGPGQLSRPASPSRCRRRFDRRAVNLGALLALPGVVEEVGAAACEPHEDWPEIAAGRRRALDKTQAAGPQEGRAWPGAPALGRSIQDHLSADRRARPLVVQAYQKRLVERVPALVRQGVTVEPKDLIREVAILADRTDITEEIVRLRAHWSSTTRPSTSPRAPAKARIRRPGDGPRDNTIGSKASDVEISRRGRDQGSSGKDPRADPKCGVTARSRLRRRVTGANFRVVDRLRPSGSGKSTLVRAAARRPGLGSACRSRRRPARRGRARSRPRLFLHDPRRVRRRSVAELLESAEVHGNLYGTPAEPVPGPRKRNLRHPGDRRSRGPSGP